MPAPLPDDTSKRYREAVAAVRTDHQQILAKTRQRTVRLVVSIPAISVLLVLGTGVLIYNRIWTLSVESTMPEPLRDQVDAASTMVLAITAAIGVASALIGYLLALQIVGPLQNIEKTMVAVLRGELNRRTRVTQLGELGFLGNTFNRMVDSLQTLFEERDRALADREAVGRLVLDNDGRVICVDESVQKILGAPAESLIGYTLNAQDEAAREAVPPPLPDDLDESLCAMFSLARKGTIEERSFEFASDRVTIAISVSIHPILSGTEGTPQWLVEVRDISGRQAFHERIRRADRLAAIGTLATGIAHEIRNPLASIKGMVQLLDERTREVSGEPPPEAEYYRRIVGEVVRLETLVKGIMDFAQGDDAPAEEIDLNDLLRDVADAARQAAGDPLGVELRFELDPNMPRAVLQPDRLRQAFLNLGLNAYQHSAERLGGYVRISSLFLSVNDRRPVILCFANPCEPIPKDLREKMFEPFFTTKSNGTGLGLPVAYQAVVSNGGVLEVECEDGEVQFWIRLPLAMPTADSMRIGAGAARE